MTIHYLSSNSGVEPHLVAYAEAQEIKLVPYQERDPSIEYLLLIEPIICGQFYYAVSSLWKHWLMANAPEVKLMIAAFANPSGHRNFLSLLALPDNLKLFVRYAHPVGYYQPVYRGTEVVNGLKKDRYSDFWTIQLPQSGEPVQTNMERFLDGHDPANSFQEQLTRLRKGMLSLPSEGTKNSSQTGAYLEIKKELEKLLERWHHYASVMPYLPFWPELQTIQKELDALKNLIYNDRWSIGNTAPQMTEIEQIQQILQASISPIVHAEDYW